MIIHSSEELQVYIRKFISERNITLEYLSSIMNISATALSSRLHQKNISIKLLLEICDALNADIDITIVPR